MSPFFFFLDITYRLGVWHLCWVLAKFFWSMLYERVICDAAIISAFGWSGTIRYSVGGRYECRWLVLGLYFFTQIEGVSCVCKVFSCAK